MVNRTSVFLSFTFAYFLSYFFRSANAVIAPDLVRELGLTAAELGLMTSLFYAAFAAVQVPLGVALDRFGPRLVTPALMAAALVGSLVFAGGHSWSALALGRALIGVGMAGVLMGSLKAFSQWFPAGRYSTMTGLLIGIGSAGALVAATPLALASGAYGWRAVFVGGAVAVAASALAVVFFTRNTPPGMRWPGQAANLRSLSVVFRDRRFWRIAALVFFTNGVLLSYQGLWAGPYLNDIYGVDAVTRGNVLLGLSLGVTLGLLPSGWLADRFGLGKVVVVGAAVMAGALLLLALHPPLGWVAALDFVFGLFGGLCIMLLAQPRLIFPLAITGQATTATNLFAIGGTFLLQWGMGAIIGAFAVDEAGHYPPAAYSAALVAVAVGMLVALAWYWPMRKP